MDIRSPQQALGFPVGAERCLADWGQVVSYFEHLSVSPRLLWERLGSTTEGRDLYLATITSPENMERLDDLWAVQKKLADPRGLDESEEEALIRDAKTVMMLSCSIHATEVGSTQMAMELVHDLVTRDCFLDLLDQVILLLVPCLNPDGLDMVVSWYRSTLDTPHEGTAPPWLYQKYTGHDNNRDWFMQTQAENRLVIDKIHNRWHPQIVFDQHQMGPDGPRYVLPPYIDPVDPHVDPVIQASGSALGMHIAHDLVARGFTGVAVNAIYDCYSPSRAYQHYHGGVRILSEAASCRLATSMDVPASSLKERRGFDPATRAWNNPDPWEGGEWSLRHIVDYQKAAALACLEHAAANRRLWVRGSLMAARRACLGTGEPAGYMMPVPQPGATAPEELAAILIKGLVEVHRLLEPVTVGGREYAPGSLWVPLNQPFSAFAGTLLATGSYPDIRQYPGGPPQVPYDITGHNLPLLLDVEVVPITGSETGAGPGRVKKWPISPPLAPEDLCLKVPEPKDGWLLDGSRQRSFSMVNRALGRGQRVARLTAEGDQRSTPGDFWIVGNLDDDLPAGLDVCPAEGEPDESWKDIRLPRIGLYRSHVPNADEGWTRWVMERYGFPYRSLTDADIRSGLGEDLDVLILPDHNVQLMKEGLPASTYPARFSGGLGDGGAAALESFALGGGTILALGQASSYLAGELGLSVRDITRGLGSTEFYARGTLVQALINPRHPASVGLGRRVTGLLNGGPVFEVKNGTIIASFPWNNVVADGFLLGEEWLGGRAAVSEIPVGKGRCILSSLRLQFRDQARGTYPLLFNILYAARRERGEC